MKTLTKVRILFGNLCGKCKQHLFMDIMGEPIGCTNCKLGVKGEYLVKKP